MFERINLARPIHPDSTMDEDDVFNTKTALKSLGHFKTPVHGLTRFPDIQMIDGVRSFQRAKGLHVDGIMNPGGPTHSQLNNELARQRVEKQVAAETPNQEQTSQIPEKNDGYVKKTASAFPPIVLKIAEIFGMTVAAAWAWWQSMSRTEQVEIKAEIGSKRIDGPDRDDCDELYYKVDIPTCNAISKRRGKRAAARCFASASERYAACLKGVPTDRLPPLDTWNN